ncbi:uncharacterized protein LOC115392990 [Salarias fasciatus]|uniref:uncharacterized protein LOC115392990 n=1 Tax=Salarias fasciatus TaxID=181472 RepID=UPI0011770911|nr:uncharacterized protein LOC115392990 [Salarias fasciatus]
MENSGQESAYGNSNQAAATAQSAVEPRRLSIQRCIQSLVHACQCRNASCSLPSCQKMKRVVQHTKGCKRKTNGGCPVCKQLIALCCYHAKHCEENRCRVPFCLNVKQKLRQQQLQQRLQQALMLRRRMASMQRVGQPTGGPPGGNGLPSPGANSGAAVLEHTKGLIHVAEVVHGKLAVSKMVVIRFSEAEATVESIATKVREALGSEEGFILTDCQGREILDSEDTRSSQYWKQNSSNIFALPENEFRDFQNGQRAKRSRRAEDSDLQDVVQHIDGLKCASDSISQPSEMAEKKATEAHVKPVKEAFTCLVCLDVMVEPTFSKCCCSLLGCGACVREWLLTSDHCLKCRSPNFKRNIHSVKGLDAALAFMK